MPYIKGSFQNQNGYIILRMSNNKVIPLHRYIWEKAYGKIPKGCEIHHMDENKLNNTLSNYACCTPVKHRKHHKKNGSGGYNKCRKVGRIVRGQ